MQERGTRGIDLSMEPLDDYVVIQPSDEESETNLGLILPASAEADCRTGVVTAVGNEATGVEPGDTDDLAAPRRNDRRNEARDGVEAECDHRPAAANRPEARRPQH